MDTNERFLFMQSKNGQPATSSRFMSIERLTVKPSRVCVYVCCECLCMWAAWVRGSQTWVFLSFPQYDIAGKVDIYFASARACTGQKKTTKKEQVCRFMEQSSGKDNFPHQENTSSPPADA